MVVYTGTSSHIRPLVAAISSGVAIRRGVNLRYMIWEVRTVIGLLLLLLSDVFGEHNVSLWRSAADLFLDDF